MLKKERGKHIMAEKMTRAMALEMAISAVEDADAKEILKKIKASIEKKNGSSTHKTTDAQKWLRNEIVRILESATRPLSIGEIGAQLDMSTAPNDAKTSTSAITANIGTMLANGKTPNPNGIVYRTTDKRVAKFSLSAPTSESETDVE